MSLSTARPIFSEPSGGSPADPGRRILSIDVARVDGPPPRAFGPIWVDASGSGGGGRCGGWVPSWGGPGIVAVGACTSTPFTSARCASKPCTSKLRGGPSGLPRCTVVPSVMSTCGTRLPCTYIPLSEPLSMAVHRPCPNRSTMCARDTRG